MLPGLQHYYKIEIVIVSYNICVVSCRKHFIKHPYMVVDTHTNIQWLICILQIINNYIIVNEYGEINEINQSYIELEP